MKKILVDVERLRYPNTGLSNVSESLIRGLGQFSDVQGITIYGPKQKVNSMNLSFPIHAYHEYHKVYSSFTQEYDIIYVGHQLSKIFHHKKENQKKIVTLHDLNFLYEPISSQKQKKIIRLVEKNISNADVIVCISEFVKKDFLTHKSLFNISCNQEVRVIYNGLIFPEKRSFDWGVYQYLKEKKYIVSIGVIFPKKNQMTLLKMLPYIQEDLVLIYSDEEKTYKEELMNYIKQNNLQNRVHWLENIEQEQKYAILSQAQALMHPSLAEGFGIPVIEAMYFGKPVFLNNLTSLPEVGGDCAFYFQDDTPSNMASDYQLGMRIYKENIADYQLKYTQRALNFDYRKMARSYWELFKEFE